MLVIRHQQMEALSDGSLDAFETEMVQHCREKFPQLCKVIGEKKLRIAIRRAIDRARDYKITNRGPLAA